MKLSSFRLSVLGSLLLTSSVLAQSSSTAPQSAQGRAPCTAPESRQFDFWIGEWSVLGQGGSEVGRNSIKPHLVKCVLHERWKGKGGLVGESFNAYDPIRKRWHQTWVDSQGNLLLLEGGFTNGTMVMTDKDIPGKTDAKAVNEVTWTPAEDGTVRQHWRRTTDGGTTWTTVFDGKYVRLPSESPVSAK
ncbi:MAG: hypothetical protein SF172_17590 [Burkholderiales bacterium]|nr:hypothetical protein [Burkholderiales bacterium]